MKKLFVLTMCLVLAFSINALAVEGNPQNGLSEDIHVHVEIGPYASVAAYKTIYEESSGGGGNGPGRGHGNQNGSGGGNGHGHGGGCWTVKYIKGNAGMDFQTYTGEAGFGKIADTNCFVLETNTALTLEFSGTALECLPWGDKMLTRYWVWQSEDPDDLPIEGKGKGCNRVEPPGQIIPVTEIGLFGPAGPSPRFDQYEIVGPTRDWLDALMAAGDFSEAEELFNYFADGTGWEGPVVASTGNVNTNGFYAFQVFGFVSTNEISSQRAGDYVGEIILTVSK